jgi:hypothetical protein
MNDLKFTIKIEYENGPESATVAVATINSANPGPEGEGPCPDCLKQQILGALLSRSDLKITVEENEYRYHLTAEERQERRLIRMLGCEYRR